MVESKQSQAFYILISTFDTEHVHRPKALVETHCAEPPLLLINLPSPAQNWELATGANFLSDEPLIASVHYKPTNDREVQMNLHEVVTFKNQQRLRNDWPMEANSFE